MKIHPPAYKDPVEIPDDQLWGLQGYDVAYIVDDSSLMSWEEKHSKIVPWIEARRALKTFATICAEWDDDGQDLYFINSTSAVIGASPEQIDAAFSNHSPHGGTNMGKALMRVLDGYFDDFAQQKPKPLNILAITDGIFTDDVASVIKWTVQQMDRVRAPPNQVGIQFVQIGADPSATKALEHLDDDLVGEGLSRDIVDTVPWYPRKVDGRTFDGMYLVKVVCGSINKKLDGCDYSRKSVSQAARESRVFYEPKKRKGLFRRMMGV